MNLDGNSSISNFYVFELYDISMKWIHLCINSFLEQSLPYTITEDRALTLIRRVFFDYYFIFIRNSNESNAFVGSRKRDKSWALKANLSYKHSALRHRFPLKWHYSNSHECKSLNHSIWHFNAIIHLVLDLYLGKMDGTGYTEPFSIDDGLPPSVLWGTSNSIC